MGVGTPYLPLPPPLHPRKPCRARSEHGAWVERRGRGRGRSGIVGPPFTFPRCRPEKKRRLGKGGRGGGNHPQYQTRPSPYPPPSLARSKGPKTPWLGWEREGGGAGGNITTSSSVNKGFKDRLPLAQSIFFVFGFKTGEMLPVFKKKIGGSIRSLNFFLKKLGSIRCFPNISMIQGQAQNLCYLSLFFTSKQGEMLPVFKKTLFGSIRSLKFSFKKNWVHLMFSGSFHEQGLQGQAQSCCFLSFFLR